MASGRASELNELPAEVIDIVTGARRAVLATIDSKGRPHALPVGFAVVGERILSAVDEKPKTGRRLARLTNVAANPTATMTFDRWDEDWSRLGGVMVRGRAAIEPPGSGSAELLARYPQYGGRPPSGDVIALTPDDIVWWMWATAPQP